MSKYRKHYMSKYKYPTVGSLVGHKLAQRELTGRLGRQLHDDTKIVSRSGNWVFLEPKGLDK